MLYRFMVLLFVVGFVACKQSAPVVETSSGDFFGEKFKTKTTIDYVDLLNKISNQDTLEVVVEGYIGAVCQAKGCWANLVQDMDHQDPSIFVKFKDYAFFLPMDSAGQELILKGKAYKEITSVDELRHYAEDEGKSAEEIAMITKPVEEMKFMASGAFLKKK